MMRVLVTGGGGFVGRAIVHKLLARGDAVRVLGRNAYPDLQAAGAECVRADLADTEAVAVCCDRLDAVIHVAARTGVSVRRTPYEQANLLGTGNVLDACRKQGVKRLVYTSTPSVVYGTKPIRGGDESLPYPKRYLAPYPATKAEAEQAVLAANGQDGLQACAIRPHLVWGVGDTNLVPRLLARADAGRLRIIGDGANRVSIAYVSDVADAHLAALDRLEPGGAPCGKAYFVNGDDPVNCWDFVNRILAAYGRAAITRRVPLRVAYALGMVFESAYRMLGRDDDPPMTRFLALQLATDHWFENRAAKRDLGWTPATTVEAGLAALRAEAERGGMTPQAQAGQP